MFRFVINCTNAVADPWVLGLIAGRSVGRIPDRGKLSLRSIAVDAKINYLPSLHFKQMCRGLVDLGVLLRVVSDSIIIVYIFSSGAGSCLLQW